VLKIPNDSPLRNAYSLFWSIRNNDEGPGRVDGFHALVEQGKINLFAPAKVKGYASDGESIVLWDERTLRADAVILATGFSSSWTGIFTGMLLISSCHQCSCLPASEKTIEELGIGGYPPSQDVDEWTHYKTLASPPAAHPQRDEWTSSIYRGLVPAKNITKRDFAINGALVSCITINKYFNVFFIHNTIHVTSHVSQ
jgi:dimethylaniline monooxygenase (N-oxide forming)